MNKTLFLALIAGCGPVWAQTGAQVAAANPMPDGSRDMYVGLGAQSAPRWEGAEARRVRALPLLQVQWSNGIFISGNTAGMHLLDDPAIEAGPLLMLQPGRSEGGVAASAGGTGVASIPATIVGSRPVETSRRLPGRLDGMDDIRTRVLVGGFANYYLDTRWRLAGNLLYGAGNERDGARLELGVQRLAMGIGAHHRASLSAGIGIVNRHYSQTYFGVTVREASRSGFPSYAPGGGLQDLHAGLRWNWDWTPSWMLTTNLQARRLLGSARHSPLVERPTNLTVSTAVAYRF